MQPPPAGPACRSTTGPAAVFCERCPRAYLWHVLVFLHENQLQPWTPCGTIDVTSTALSGHAPRAGQPLTGGKCASSCTTAKKSALPAPRKRPKVTPPADWTEHALQLHSRGLFRGAHQVQSLTCPLTVAQRTHPLVGLLGGLLLVVTPEHGSALHELLSKHPARDTATPHSSGPWAHTAPPP